jgi:acetyltransferase-like isoleucine patch superfamily enzyme
LQIYSLTMKSKIKSFLKKYPILEKYFFLLKNGSPQIIKNIKGEKNRITVDKAALLKNCTFDIVGNSNEITINKSCVFNNVTFFIRGNNNKIHIDQHVHFNRGGSIWIEDMHCEAIIGSYSTFEDVHIAVTEPHSKISIGTDCMFAYDIDIRSGDSHSIIDTHTNKRINYAQDVVIGNHVWVAAHVSILKGVTLANNSVVATRSVVTKSFEQENTLIGGMPAKVIKEHITWDRKRIYQH